MDGSEPEYESPPYWQTAEHHRRLVATIRAVATWRRAKGLEFGNDDGARKASMRAATALRVLANAAEAMPEDDPRLRCLGASRIADEGQTYRLSREAFESLSRFGLARGAWRGAGHPSDAQITNILNRVEGCEAQARSAARERAAAGYGEA